MVQRMYLKRPACVIAARKRPGALNRIIACAMPYTVAGGRQISTGGSERAPRARTKVRLVLDSGLFAPASPSLLISDGAAAVASPAAVAPASGADERNPRGAGRRRLRRITRRAGVSRCLGVHHAEAAHRAGVGGAPGREVVLLGRDRPGLLLLLGPGHGGVPARGDLASADHVPDSVQPAAAPHPR